MKAIIYPSCSKNTVVVPASKSYLHRYIIASILTKDICVIDNANMGEDTYATINAFLALGVKYNLEKNKLTIDARSLKKVDRLVIDANESASTLRFLIPLLINFANVVEFNGRKSLLNRPMEEYAILFGDDIEISSKKIIVKAPLKGDTFYVNSNVSSQYVTGLIFALSVVNHPSTIILQGNIASSSYIKLTVDVLNKYGINVKWDEDVIYVIPAPYQKQEVIVEGDYTIASNYVVLSKINNEIEIKGLNPDSYQGDKAIYDLLDSEVIDLDQNIDLGPILMAYASTFAKKTKFIHTNRLFYKESNRLMAMKEELNKLGVNLEVYDDVCFVNGKTNLTTKEELDSHNDHRICMALAILATICKDKVVINNIECVNKSYPRFFEDLKDLGIKIELK